MKKCRMWLLLFIAYTIIICISSALCVHLIGLSRIGAVIILVVTIVTAVSMIFKEEK